ncbi:MAG: M23 family metallopeptidase [Clostridium sp.]|jgi:murein DD-endopeptidase MepM/ murein hydrolase activator NlpD|nr:M23 family metallopeptidase [Clostridium sp.]
MLQNIIFNMTYEEYKNKKDSKANNIFKKILSKLFTIVIFTMIVITLSNMSPKFKSFIVDKVLNSTIDFSFVNKLSNKVTNVFKTSNNTLPVVKEENNRKERYKDGIKYIVNKGASVNIKDSGIVTYIGNKDGYNNTVIIQQSNGYYAWYGNIKEEVKLYDYIESGSKIGETLTNEYYYVLLKDNKPVNLNED